LNWSQIVLHSNNVFEFSTIEPLRKQSNETDSQANDVREQNDPGKTDQIFLFCSIDLIILEMLLTTTTQRDVQEEYLRLRGQMLYVYEWKAIIYLATPV
jgi:hypothetical protein